MLYKSFQFLLLLLEYIVSLFLLYLWALSILIVITSTITQPKTILEYLTFNSYCYYFELRDWDSANNVPLSILIVITSCTLSEYDNSICWLSILIVITITQTHLTFLWALLLLHFQFLLLLLLCHWLSGRTLSLPFNSYCYYSKAKIVVEEWWLILDLSILIVITHLLESDGRCKAWRCTFNSYCYYWSPCPCLPQPQHSLYFQFLLLLLIFSLEVRVWLTFHPLSILIVITNIGESVGPYTVE